MIKDILNEEQKQLVANIIVDIEKKDKEIERLRNKINLAICYIEKGKTFRTEETRKEVEYIQNNLLEILDKVDKGEE